MNGSSGSVLVFILATLFTSAAFAQSPKTASFI
jgi:hypothetical protein